MDRMINEGVKTHALMLRHACDFALANKVHAHRALHELAPTSFKDFFGDRQANRAVRVGAGQSKG
jgi:hypothetical protein